jgi:hypothetical protein
MSVTGHLYRKGTRGRSLASAPGIGGVSHTARLHCARCPAIGVRKLRQVLPPDQIDKKFAQLGWSLDPCICPDCKRRASQEKTMATKPSPAAIKSQAKMFTLLQQHFDPELGAFAEGWSDQRIATDTNLSPDTIAEFRREAFGEIKEPDEVRKLRDDINSLEGLQRESAAQFSQDIAGLRSRLAGISARWAA